jgi:hypothetical protein
MTELIQDQAGRPLALYIVIAALIAATTVFMLYWMLPYFTTTEVEHMRQHELGIPHFIAVFLLSCSPFI